MLLRIHVITPWAEQREAVWNINSLHMVRIQVLESQELPPAFTCASGEFLMLISVAKYQMSVGDRGVCQS